MFRTLHRAVLGFTLFAGLIAGSPAIAAVPRLDDEAPEQSVSGDWRGGAVSLPIGRGYSQSEILNASFALPQTQELINSFLARGYLRRADKDRAGSSDTLAYVQLAWERPGVPFSSEVPMIQVLSKTYFDRDAGKQVVATQAMGGVLRDSSGTLVTYLSGQNAPIAIGEVVPPGTPGAIAIDRSKLPQESGDVWAYRMAYRDGPGGIGTMYKDAVKAACPWAKTITTYAVAGGFGALGTVEAISGNPWGAAGLLMTAKAADQWIEAKWTCH